jgi:hypothetical protein
MVGEEVAGGFAYRGVATAPAGATELSSVNLRRLLRQG